MHCSSDKLTFNCEKLYHKGSMTVTCVQDPGTRKCKLDVKSTACVAKQCDTDLVLNTLNLKIKQGTKSQALTGPCTKTQDLVCIAPEYQSSGPTIAQCKENQAKDDCEWIYPTGCIKVITCTQAQIKKIPTSGSTITIVNTKTTYAENEKTVIKCENKKIKVNSGTSSESNEISCSSDGNWVITTTKAAVTSISCHAICPLESLRLLVSSAITIESSKTAYDEFEEVRVSCASTNLLINGVSVSVFSNQVSCSTTSKWVYNEKAITTIGCQVKCTLQSLLDLGKASELSTDLTSETFISGSTVHVSCGSRRIGYNSVSATFEKIQVACNEKSKWVLNSDKTVITSLVCQEIKKQMSCTAAFEAGLISCESNSGDRLCIGDDCEARCCPTLRALCDIDFTGCICHRCHTHVLAIAEASRPVTPAMKEYAKKNGFSLKGMDYYSIMNARGIPALQNAGLRTGEYNLYCLPSGRFNFNEPKFMETCGLFTKTTWRQNKPMTEFCCTYFPFHVKYDICSTAGVNNPVYSTQEELYEVFHKPRIICADKRL
eukprot:c21939_g1_i3.p1 GENE.c21939_g1_i3~~c21939_g1_i3.p1  ORF type:complete len:546 (+),score=142.23 c21939_g1_i3:197-1834(+)